MNTSCLRIFSGIIIVFTFFSCVAQKKKPQEFWCSITTDKEVYSVGDTLFYEVKTSNKQGLGVKSRGDCNDTPFYTIFPINDTSKNNYIFNQLCCGRGFGVLQDGEYSMVISLGFPKDIKHTIVYFTEMSGIIESNAFVVK